MHDSINSISVDLIFDLYIKGLSLISLQMFSKCVSGLEKLYCNVI